MNELIFIIGPPGSGKTVCGQALADALECPFFDTDRLIEEDEKRTVSAIFQEQGEAHFRQLERQLLERLPGVAAAHRHTVFATGGGMPVYNDNLQRMLALGKVVALFAELPVLLERVKTNRQRPLLADACAENSDESLRERLSQLIAQRSPVYALAGYKIDTSGLTPQQVAHEIIGLLYGNE